MQKQQNKSSTVDALLTLLADEDETIASQAEKHLLEIGEQASPYIKADLSNQPPEVRIRLEQILEQIEPRLLHNTFRNLPVDRENFDLIFEPALLAFTRVGFPDFNIKKVISQLSSLAAKVNNELQRWETIDDHTRVKVVRDVLLEKQGFKGISDTKEDAPNHYFLNWILERKTASPLALCCLIKLVCDRVKLPFQIVGLPVHAFLRFTGETEVLFMDPSFEGKFLTREDCREYLERTGFDFVEEYLEPLTNKQVLQRLLRELMDIFHRHGNTQREKELQSYLTIISRRY